ncbi:MAG TPA: CRISPR-associated protein Csx16 [Sedimenticola sp.]|nr:CRISPR-associated protein Csx16 [Sedimenticola sp.]
MTSYFVTRHHGAREWARRRGLGVDVVCEHLDIGRIRPGDRVIGSLPVNLAADVCARGGRYLHLGIDLPFELRGRELTADQMEARGARVEEYRVTRVGSP